MADLRSRLQALIDDIKHAPSAPSIEVLEEFTRRRKELDAELLRTTLSPRTKIAADVARAAAERAQHAAQHPTILDPAPRSTSALARHSTGNAFAAAIDRSDDGYDR
ncbi:hypothetical protein [Nocardia salmonicida]|uniref:hypothetical protein n=1 Tax=Nocardia salmonicida TaxID=53431 RepID=UPI0007A3FAA9|nr:hypothetical protein [Nocardia salmonicida]MBC7299525.1 hypothetical protein [Nocardia sp.]